MIGKRFGRLVVVKLTENRKYNKIFECICDCGKTKHVFQGNLRRGFTVSCGCLHSEELKKRSTTHGLTQSKTYSAWTDMKTRCLNPNHIGYLDYGGRGITVCDRWLESFENFLADMGEIPFKGAQLDRIKNSEGYSPDNCKWSTRSENARNKRSSVFLTFEGRTLTVVEWSEVTGIKKSILYNRLYLHWTTERLLTQPTQSLSGKRIRYK